MHTVSLEVLDLLVRKNQEWFDESDTEVQLLIEQMHSSHKTWN